MKNLRHQVCKAVWSWIAIVSIFGVGLIDAQVDQVQVDAITAFKNGISVDPNNTLASWQGDDPCAFTGLTCGTIRATATGASSDIIQIKLDGLNLTGTISPALIGLTGLQVLYLSNNHFHGPIPNGLENLTNLLLVDFSNNNLNGTVPLGLAAKPGISLFVDGNLDLCDPRGLTECAVPSINSALPGVVPSSAKKGGDGLSGGAIFGIVLAVLILGGVAAGGAFYWFKVHRKKTRATLNFERFTGMGISDGDRL